MEYIILGVDALVVSALYYYYTKNIQLLINVQNAPDLTNTICSHPGGAGVDGGEHMVVDYGMFVGKVRPDGQELISHYNAAFRGCVRVLEIREHGTTWTKNMTSDTTRLISRVISDAPFSLESSATVSSSSSSLAAAAAAAATPMQQAHCLHVVQPLRADFVLDSLDLTHKHFEPVKQSVVSDILARLTSNETIRGIETSEHMLCAGTQLTAFGKIERLSGADGASGASWRLSEPVDKAYTFILTTMSRSAIVDRLRHTSRTLRVCLVVFGSLGAVLGLYCACAHLRRWQERRRRARAIVEARLQRIKNQRARAHRDNEILYNSNMNMVAAQNEMLRTPPTPPASSITGGVRSSSSSSSSSSGGVGVGVGAASYRSNTDSNSLSRQQSSSTSNDSTACVICLINPRDLVLIDCGHVCLCMDCFECLPTNNCPICRKKFKSFMPCYIP